MKKLFLIPVILLGSCTTSDSTSTKITQYIEAAGLGMVKVNKLSAPERINDSTYSAVHSFDNKMIDNQVRITNTYYFTTDLSKIKNHNTTKTEIKSAGDWVETKL